MIDDFQAKRVTIRAVPSVEEQKRMAKEESDRVEKQREELKESGLAKKAEDLNDAVAKNDIPPPDEMLTKVPIPNVRNINSLPSTILERDGTVYGDPAKLFNLNLDDMPVPINITACGIDSNFGYVSISTFTIII